MSEIREMPMFPLGSVLFPQGVLPLHIFEQRYQQLLNHALETDRKFGVVLISRGSEVGGGETRNSIGTVAVIDEHQRFDDGRAAVVSTGTSRIEVVEWLDDDPFPKAMVRELDVEPVTDEHGELLTQAKTTFTDLLALGQRLGRLDQVPDSTWEDDVERATWQLAGRSPCTALDQYTVLAAPTRSDRVRRIVELLQDVTTDLEMMGRLDNT